MLKDKFNRSLEVLKISANSDCQFSCDFCDGAKEKTGGPPIETYRIVKFVRTMALLGLKKVRIDGMEPLLRPDIIELLTGLASIKPKLKISLSTNGKLLKSMAPDLQLCGLDKIFVSLPSLDKSLFEAVTGKDGLDEILENIEYVRMSHQLPLVIFMPLISGTNDKAMEEMADWAVSSRLNLYVVEKAIGDGRSIIGSDEIVRRLKEKFTLSRMEGVSIFNNPWKVEDHQTFIKVVSCDDRHHCHACNRLWLKSDGVLTLCKACPENYDLNDVFDSGLSDTELVEFACKIPLNKPFGTDRDVAAARNCTPAL